MKVAIPDLALVALVGVSGSGKSSFADRHFSRTEVVSSDYCRGLISDDENDQSASQAAFDLVHYIAAKRLEAGRLTVVDATNVQPESRRALVALAKKHHVLSVAIVLNVSTEVCAQRNANRPDRDFGPHVLRNQNSQLRRSMKNLRREGFTKSSFSTASRRSTTPPLCASHCGPIAAAIMAPSTSLVTFTGVSTNSSPCCAASATRWTPTAPALGIPTAGVPFSWVTSSTVDPPRRRCCVWLWVWSALATRCVSRATTKRSFCALCRAAT